jgi:DNA processing protein
VTGFAAAERVARAALTFVAEPGDEVMGALLRACSPAEIVAALTEGRMPLPAVAPDGDVGGRTGVPMTADLRDGNPARAGVLFGPAVRGDGDSQTGRLFASTVPGGGEDGRAGIPGLGRALRRWAARLGDVPPERTLDAWRRGGIRLVIPSDPEWPGQLDVLGDARPWGLWVRGDTDLRYACLRSVSVVGTRAATAYGAHVCAELAMALAESGWTVVSGGA